MRQGQHNKRARGRNRKPQNSANRSYESNGPEVKIRGNAAHVAEKYATLAREALTSGDPISAENYHQHAEHYLRILAVQNANQQAHAQAQATKNDNVSANGAVAVEEKANSTETVTEKANEVPEENGTERARPRRRSRSVREAGPAKSSVKTNGAPADAPVTEADSTKSEVGIDTVAENEPVEPSSVEAS